MQRAADTARRTQAALPAHVIDLRNSWAAPRSPADAATVANEVLVQLAGWTQWAQGKSR